VVEKGGCQVYSLYVSRRERGGYQNDMYVDGFPNFSVRNCVVIVFSLGEGHIVEGVVSSVSQWDIDKYVEGSDGLSSYLI